MRCPNNHEVKEGKQMFKSLIVRIAKRYILGNLNDFLFRNKDNAKKVAEQVALWSSRLNTIILALNKIVGFVKDGKLDDNEARQTMEILNDTVRDFH